MSKWVVLTQPNCIYCTQAVKLLNDKGEMDVIRMSIAEKPDLKTFVLAQGLSTMPQVYADGEWIGGFDDLVEHFKLKDGFKKSSDNTGWRFDVV